MASSAPLAFLSHPTDKTPPHGPLLTICQHLHEWGLFRPNMSMSLYKTANTCNHFAPQLICLLSLTSTHPQLYPLFSLFHFYFLSGFAQNILNKSSHQSQLYVLFEKCTLNLFGNAFWPWLWKSDLAAEMRWWCLRIMQ